MNEAKKIDVEELELHRPLLMRHCYQMLGSPCDAADAVQEVFVRAVRFRDGFDGRASLRTWLLRIATNVCIDEIGRRKRRELPMAWPSGEASDPIEFRPAEEWIEPAPDPLLGIDAVSPARAVILREQVRLAFIAALQYLPAKQRGALLLSDVVGCTAAETAESLDMSVAAVNSALQRAREKLARAPIVELDHEASDTVDRYVAAFEAFDVDALARLLADEIKFSMPPIALWLEGPRRVVEFLKTTGSECEGSRLVPVAANGLPAFAQYRHGGSTPWGLVTLEVHASRVVGISTFLDHERLFPLFGLPASVP